MKYEHHCYRCGRSFLAISDNPNRCSRKDCKSMVWDIPRGEKNHGTAGRTYNLERRTARPNEQRIARR
jgi:hypothetical protein